MEAKRTRKATLSKVARPAPGLVTTSPSETPSTISRSSFSPSVFSQVDSQSFNEETDSALASLDDLNDLERWANLTSTADAATQFYQTESHGMPTVRHRTVNSPEVSTNLQTNFGYLPQRDDSFDHLLGLRDGISDGGSYNAGGLVTTGGLSGLEVGTSGPMSSVSSGHATVQTTGFTGLANTQGQVSTPAQQSLSTTTSLVYAGTLPRRPGGTSTLMWNIPSVRLSSSESSTIVLPNAQQHQQSTPVPQVLPTTSSLVPPAASLERPVRQGPVEIVVPASDVVRQTVSNTSLPQPSSMAMPLRRSVVASSPVTPVLSTWQEALAPSAAVALSAMFAPGLQTLSGGLQESNFSSAMFKDALQTGYLAVQQFYRISAVVLSAVHWMSQLCGMALQGMQQVAMLSQSTLYNVAERFRERKPVTNTCAPVLSNSLSLGLPMTLQV